jgi:hypothetical protein
MWSRHEVEVAAVIPTMILFGLVTGYWWRFTLATSAILWPCLLLWPERIISAAHIPGAAMLGAANAAIGVVMVQGVAFAFRRIRRHLHPSDQASPAP